MKCETTNTVLTLLLALLVLAGVVFALQSILRQREFRNLQAQVVLRQTNMNRLNMLLNEASLYGKTHPDINRLLQPFVAKPAAR